MKNKKHLSFLFILMLATAQMGYSQDYMNALKLGGSGPEFIKGLAVNSDGDLVVSGTFQNTVDFDMSSSGTAEMTATSEYDVYIAKYNDEGEYRWAIALGGEPYTYHEVRHVDTDKDGNIYITGFTDNWIDFDPSAGEAILNSEEKIVIYVAKYNTDGEYIWAFTMGNFEPSASSALNAGWGIAVDDDSEHLYVAGTYWDTIDFDPSVNEAKLVAYSGSDVFLAKYTLDGSYVWANSFGYDGGGNYGKVGELDLDEQGNIYMAGYFTGTLDMDGSGEELLITAAGTSSAIDCYLSKYNPEGQAQWAFRVGSEGYDYNQSVDYHNGKIYTTGEFEGIVDFDPSDGMFSMEATENEYSSFMAAYNPDGSFDQAIGLINTEGACSCEDISFDASGNFYLTGGFFGTMDCDPSASTATITSTGGISDYDMYLAKYDAAGNYTWAINAGGNSQEQGFFTWAKGDDFVMSFGYFDGDCDFDPSAEEHYLNHSGSSHDVYFAWYSTFPGSGVGEQSPDQLFSVYPNPASGDCQLSINLAERSDVKLLISDMAGRRILEKDLGQLPPGSYTETIELNIPAGTYTMMLFTGDKVYSSKLVKLQ